MERQRATLPTSFAPLRNLTRGTSPSATGYGTSSTLRLLRPTSPGRRRLGSASGPLKGGYYDANDEK